MKKHLLFLFVAQVICFSTALSQTTPEKPATDACPNWNKKQPASKAEYFSYLSKRNKAKDNIAFNTPKYQNYNANKTTTASEKKQQQNTFVVKTTNEEKVKQPVLISEEKNTSSKSTRESTDKTIAVPKPVEIKTTEKMKPTEPIAEQGDATSSVQKEKKQIETNKSNIKHYRKHWFKKIRLRKKSATTCPDF